jgi:hypothetical protein
VTLWDLLLPLEADEQSRRLLAALFNRHLQATFWASFRGWAMYRLDPAQVGHLMLRLLEKGAACLEMATLGVYEPTQNAPAWPSAGKDILALFGLSCLRFCENTACKPHASPRRPWKNVFACRLLKRKKSNNATPPA